MTETFVSLLRKARINTICESAKCPNLKECFSKGTSTILILGEGCTRNCRFCNLNRIRKIFEPDRSEPDKIAEFVKKLKMKYVVITSPTRDDLGEYVARHYASVISSIHKKSSCKIEVLTPDFKGFFSSIKIIVDAGIDVFSHNIETVPRLYKKIRPEANYDLSLSLLNYVKKRYNILTKSGIILGFGETEKEIHQTIKDIRMAGVDILTIGQYFPPTIDHFPLKKVYSEKEFLDLENYSKSIGFSAVRTGTYVRSSYCAEEMFEEALKNVS